MNKNNVSIGQKFKRAYQIAFWILQGLILEYPTKKHAMMKPYFEYSKVIDLSLNNQYSTQFAEGHVSLTSRLNPLLMKMLNILANNVSKFNMNPRNAVKAAQLDSGPIYPGQV